MEPGCSQQGPVRVILWCYPRTLSTALTKCLSFTEGLEVWFEPFMYCAIANAAFRMETGRELPREYAAENAEEFELAAATVTRRLNMSSTSVSPDRIAYGSVKQRLESTQSRLVLVKDMSIAIWNESLLEYIPSGYQHVFLIRDPRSALYSFRKACIIRDKPLDEMAYDVVKDDLFLDAGKFIPSLHSLWTFIREKVHPNPMVINADDLTRTPGAVLEKFCSHIGLPYSDALLHWDKSADVIQRWKACGETLVNEIPIFFHDAVTSSEFVPSKSKPVTEEELTQDVLRLVDIAMPLYKEMNEHKI